VEKIDLFLPSIQETEDQKEMTQRCLDSLISKEYEIDIYQYTEPHKYRVAGAWNWFLDQFRGKIYSYLFVVANDTIADPNAIDYMVRCAKENPDAGLVTGKVERDLQVFSENKGKYRYSNTLTRGLIDPACFVLPIGVIEKIGRIDQQFPVEFVERDLIWRVKLAGFKVIQPDIPLWYHPPYSGTVGNDEKRLRLSFRKYYAKWGGDANDEKYVNPYNDLSLDYTFCKK
jgi:GT2 family glycosyltransferase